MSRSWLVSNRGIDGCRKSVKKWGNIGRGDRLKVGVKKSPKNGGRPAPATP